MSVTVRIHPAHRPHTDGLSAVEVEGRTVGDCLRALLRRHPAMGSRLFGKQGKILGTVVLFLNEEGLHSDELSRAVSPGDEIHITLLLAGG